MSPPRAIRILIVDDSAVMRSLLRSVILSDKRLEVVGTATDGAAGLQAMDSLCPDLILLNVEMPVLDGLSTLKEMKLKGTRIPVIMCSALTQHGARVTIEALANGAADYVAKPSGQGSREAAALSLAQELIPKILALTAGTALVADQVNLPGATPVPVSAAKAAPRSSRSKSLVIASSSVVSANVPQQSPAVGFSPAVVLIGLSTGGPAALDVLLPELPARFPLPILIVQHMPELFTKLLAERLSGRCPMRVCEATSGEPIRPGTIYIARGDWHMEIIAAEGKVGRQTGRIGASGVAALAPVLRLTQEAPENHCRPAADVLFRSGVAIYGSRVLGVVLTGMGYDGLAGCRLIREHGGVVLAQDQATSAVWGMPGAVAQSGLANRVLPLNAIAPEILRLVGAGHREVIGLREAAV